MLILADGMATLAEKGNTKKVEETLRIPQPRFFQENPNKFVGAFLSACYHDQANTADCLLRYDELHSEILHPRDFAEGLSKAAMTGSDKVIWWLLGLGGRVDLKDYQIINVVLNACMFEHVGTATKLIRHFEKTHGHLKSKMRKIFHRCFKDRKSPSTHNNVESELILYQHEPSKHNVESESTLSQRAPSTHNNAESESTLSQPAPSNHKVESELILYQR